MSVNPAETQEQITPQEKKPSDKEYNFAQLRKQVEQERTARQQAENEKAELMEQINRVAKQKLAVEDDDDANDEPYIDKRRLKKELVKVVQQTTSDTDTKINNAVQKALAEERRNMWMKNNPDFYEVMNHAQKFAEKDPELAETILEMPDTFERQKLVYKNIKALGLHKKEEPQPTIQDTVNRNQRNPYYQPSGVGTAPYASQADYSPAGQKNAYEKLKELKGRLRLG
jgi:hypothetical protein